MSVSLLETDYLNHFNEVGMSFDMLCEMPDMVEILDDWEPLTYQQHFERSGLSNSASAIEAYQSLSEMVRNEVEAAIAMAHATIIACISQLKALSPDGADAEEFKRAAGFASQQTLALVGYLQHFTASGGVASSDQDAIDSLFD